MDIRIYQETAELNNKRQVYIVNPTQKDFSLTRDDVVYTSPAGEEVLLPLPIAELLSKKIVDYMCQQKGGIISPAYRKSVEKRVKLYELL